MCVELAPKLSNISDDGLRVLAEHGDLQSLRAGGSGITDTGIAVLENMKSLSVLRLGQTSVTAKGIEEFQKALPQCEIIYDEEVVESEAEE